MRTSEIPRGRARSVQTVIPGFAKEFEYLYCFSSLFPLFPHTERFITIRAYVRFWEKSSLEKPVRSRPLQTLKAYVETANPANRLGEI